MEWCHTSSPNPQKVRVQRSAGKVMFIFFWDYNRPILEHYIPTGSTVTSATYSVLLKPAIRQKRRGLLTTGVCLLHENAKPHTATATVSTIEELLFECIPHCLYSPDNAVGFSRLRSIEGYAEWNALPGRRGSVGGA